MRILFVDDESMILDGLRRMLRGQRAEWDMAFASSGAEALQMAGQQPFDVVVSDMKMPGMDGAEMLDRFKEMCPETIRFILSGHAEREAVLRSLGATHQYMSKPCNPDVLMAAITRTVQCRTMLAGPGLQAVVSRVDGLPSFPRVFKEVSLELAKENASLRRVAELVEQDLALSARVMRVVNSAYFGLRRPISRVEHAITFLGADTISSILLSAGVFADETACKVEGFSMEALWNHCLLVSRVASVISKAENLPGVVDDDLRIAAMLHDAGKLVLAANLPQEYAQILARVGEGVPPSVAERDVLQATHAEVGAYLMALWGLPSVVVEAVAFHAEPPDLALTEVTPLAVLQVADRLARDVDLEPLLEGHAQADRLRRWRDEWVRQKKDSAA